ncbi:hypothetical protein FIBSPDRAFT_858380 [Athelia psychrophila]|uniref:Uncharacterized protein n=1 Tax=Athelia psychrophila TaxID=1759441 RepID=A0A166LXS4_9AGAM|nr:hypothetical protein FIBSPDRAFT_858380 [Fibularhizoctonia sp. CBS 109695]
MGKVRGPFRSQGGLNSQYPERRFVVRIRTQLTLAEPPAEPQNHRSQNHRTAEPQRLH